jgi:preprotein translocase subunit SecF
LDTGRSVMVETLMNEFGDGTGRPDFNNSGQQVLADALRDPLTRAGAGLADEELHALAGRMREFRDTPPRSGLITSFDDLAGVEGVTPAVIATMKDELSLAPFAIRNVDVVGPKIGEELRQQAIMATLLALGGMLVYVAFRFEWIYGVAAVVAVFHDTIITIGLFSLFGKEISLTVVAALLTLVGYSMNDTIVVFDRIRENLKTTRRIPFPELVNLSINQTLSRTVLTSGLTFLTVLALLLFGGQVLNGFAFALTAGILVGTYSSIFVASPVLIFWQGMLERRKRARVTAAPAKRAPAARSSAKAAKQ